MVYDAIMVYKSRVLVHCSSLLCLIHHVSTNSIQLARSLRKPTRQKQLPTAPMFKFKFAKLKGFALLATMSYLGLASAAPSNLTRIPPPPHTTQNSTRGVGLLPPTENSPNNSTWCLMANMTTPAVQAAWENTANYQCYSGGNDAYPARQNWLSFVEMWNRQSENVRNSCVGMAEWGGTHPGLADAGAKLKDFQLNAIREGVLEAAAASGVPDNFIFSIMLQESHGCPSVHTTDNGVQNPGLLQCHNGSEFVGNDKSEADQIASIKLMIREGTIGTPVGDGLQQCLARQGGSVFTAAREYNSGSIGWSGNLNDPTGATASYVCDIANHLTGNYDWEAFSKLNCQ